MVSPFTKCHYLFAITLAQDWGKFSQFDVDKCIEEKPPNKLPTLHILQEKWASSQAAAGWSHLSWPLVVVVVTTSSSTSWANSTMRLRRATLHHHRYQIYRMWATIHRADSALRRAILQFSASVGAGDHISALRTPELGDNTLGNWSHSSATAVSSKAHTLEHWDA